MLLRVRPLVVVIVSLGAAATLRIGLAQAGEKKDSARALPIVTPIEPKKDAKTGFVVGGKNDTALLRTLTEINGISITKLEKVMRPGASSRLGFLGKDESLLGVLAADNQRVVEEWGLTHQKLGWPLRVLGRIGEVYEAVDLKRLPPADLSKHLQALGATPGAAPNEFTFQGGKYKVKITAFRGIIDSPFEDETKTNKVADVDNLANGKKLQYSLLVPQMIERYGFYEGTGTPYRVDPRQVLEVCDFLKKGISRKDPR